jgi:hypothetical protein
MAKNATAATATNEDSHESRAHDQPAQPAANHHQKLGWQQRITLGHPSQETRDESLQGVADQQDQQNLQANQDRLDPVRRNR